MVKLFILEEEVHKCLAFKVECDRDAAGAACIHTNCALQLAADSGMNAEQSNAQEASLFHSLRIFLGPVALCDPKDLRDQVGAHVNYGIKWHNRG